jgi:hypothetical protein
MDDGVPSLVKSKALGLFFLAVGGLTALAILVVAAGLPKREPTYDGATIDQWLSREGKAPYEALVVLGTNNLSLLVRRLTYDPDKDIVLRLYGKLPQRLSRTRKVTEFVVNSVVRKLEQAEVAGRLLRALGPRAAPAIPDLIQLAQANGRAPTGHAINVLESLGEEAWPAMIPLTWHTNKATAIQVVRCLALHTASIPLRQALTNALTDPNPRVRKQANDLLAGRGYR